MVTGQQLYDFVLRSLQSQPYEVQQGEFKNALRDSGIYFLKQLTKISSGASMADILTGQVPGVDLNNILKRFNDAAEEINKSGKTIEQALPQFVKFNPQTQIEAERQRVLTEGAQIGAVPGGPPAPSSTVTVASTTSPTVSSTISSITPSSIPFKMGLTDAQKQSINTLIQTDRAFNEIDAKNYAFAIGDSNWQQYIGKTGLQILGITEPSTIGTSPTTERTGTTTETTSGTSGNNLLADLPADLASLLEGLSPEQQNLIKITYNALISGDEAARADANKALTDAIGLADPYFREQIRLVQDEILRGVASTQQDAASRVGQLQTRINQLNEDLRFNREQLTLEQQATLASQLRQYQGDLKNLQMQMTEAGLAFSSPRQEAERELATQQQEIGESTQRKFARALRETEVGALRNVQQAAQDISDVTRGAGEKTIDILRRGEQQLGTMNLPKLEGVQPLGGVTGSIAEQRQNAILNLEQTLLQRTSPEGLPV